MQRLLSISVVLIFMISAASYALYNSSTVVQNNINSSNGIGNSAVSSSGSNGIFSVNQTLVISNNTLVSGNYVQTSSQFDPFGILYDKYSGYLYVSDSSNDNLSVLNGTTGKVVQSIHLSGDPRGLTLDSDNHEIYVAIEYQNEVQIINTTSDTITGNISNIGSDPWAVVADPVNGYIYVAEVYYSTINVYNQTTGSSVAVINLPHESGTPTGPEGMTLDPVNGYLYVDNTHFSNVSVINTTTNEIQYTINVGLNPGGSFYDPVDQNIYVLDSGTENVSVIDTSNQGVISTFQVGKTAEFGTYDPEDGYLYISNLGSNNVTIVNPENYETVANVSVGKLPYQIAFDPQNYNMYVVNYESSTVSIMHPVSNVVFTQTGLNSGTEWSLKVGGRTFSSANKSISFYASNGTYNYTIQNIDGYTVSNESGSFSVNGSSVSINIIFAKILYKVIFSENGLPSGTEWVLNITKVLNSTDLTSNSYSTQLSNGTYYYNASTSGASYFSPSPGMFTVEGKNITVYANFTKNAFSITFNETGLPSGTPWDVILNSNSGKSDTNSVIFNIPDGEYEYTVQSVHGFKPIINGSGNLKVNNESLYVNITFGPAYSVLFEENSLPSGTSWSVNLANNTNSSSSGYIGFTEVNGTYNYTVTTTGNHFVPDQVAGKIKVSGKSLIYTVIFYKTITDIPSGNGMAISPNGTYAYVVETSSNQILKVNLIFGTIVGNITSVTEPRAIAITPNGSYALVTNFHNDSVLMLNLETGNIAKSINAYDLPSYGIAISPNGVYAYMTLLGETHVTKLNISGGYIAENISSFTYNSRGIAINPNGSLAYITNEAENSIMVINLATDQVVKNLTVYAPLADIAADPNGSVAFVAGFSTDNISEINLSSGSIIKNYTGFGNPEAITVSSNGTYAYVLNGNGNTISRITISQAYQVTVTEMGLPAGTEWFLNLSDGYSFKSTSSTISFTASDNTYEYSVGSGNPDYRKTPETGSFSVRGSDVSLTATFTGVTYEVVFNVSGLPSGSVWYLNISGRQPSGAITGSNYSVGLTNGTYSYNLSTSRLYFTAPNGSFEVKGYSVSVNVVFTDNVYEVTFNESCLLPAGTEWYANLSNGQSYSSSDTTVSMELGNGTFFYSLATKNKEYSAAGGSFEVSGKPQSINVSFTIVKYTVTFTETGLPTTTYWYANSTAGFNGSSSTDSISLSLTNGSYEFTITNLTYYYSGTHSLKVIVNGSNVTTTITFIHWAYIDAKINQKNATISINGINMTGLSETFNISVAQGSYNVTVYLKGYTEYYSNFTLSPGSVKNLSVDLKPVSKSVTGPSIETYLAVGGIVAAVALLGVYIFIKRRKA